MAKKAIPKRGKSKPGPKAETLIIRDPQAAIDALLNKKPASK
jgi:hypothetical protein